MAKMNLDFLSRRKNTEFETKENLEFLVRIEVKFFLPNFETPKFATPPDVFIFANGFIFKCHQCVKWEKKLIPGGEKIKMYLSEDKSMRTLKQ